MPFEIRYAKTDVMDSLAAPFYESSDRRIFRHRLQQFQVGVADADESRLHALRLDALDVIDGEAEGGVDAGGVEGADRDADVVESRFDHQTPRASAPQMCLCNSVFTPARNRSPHTPSPTPPTFISPH